MSEQFCENWAEHSAKVMEEFAPKLQVWMKGFSAELEKRFAAIEADLRDARWRLGVAGPSAQLPEEKSPEAQAAFERAKASLAKFNMDRRLKVLGYCEPCVMDVHDKCGRYEENGNLGCTCRDTWHRSVFGGLVLKKSEDQEGTTNG